MMVDGAADFSHRWPPMFYMMRYGNNSVAARHFPVGVKKREELNVSICLSLYP